MRVEVGCGRVQNVQRETIDQPCTERTHVVEPPNFNILSTKLLIVQNLKSALREARIL